MKRNMTKQLKQGGEWPLKSPKDAAEGLDGEKPVPVQENPIGEHTPLSGSGGGCYILKNGRRTKI
jgi:hypothetical protein